MYKMFSYLTQQLPCQENKGFLTTVTAYSILCFLNNFGFLGVKFVLASRSTDP